LRPFAMRPKHLSRLPNVLVVRQGDAKRLSSYVRAVRPNAKGLPEGLNSLRGKGRCQEEVGGRDGV